MSQWQPERATNSTSTDYREEVPSHRFLEKKLSILALCGIALSTGESWIVLGNSLTLAIYNGGAPAVLYGYIADSVCYWIVAASIAELASAMPSSGTVHRWAQVTGGRYGSTCRWYAGGFNFGAWIIGAASFTSFLSLQVLGLWEVTHPAFEPASWHICCTYIGWTGLLSMLMIFGEKWLPTIQSFGVFFTVAGWLISTIVCAVMPRVLNHEYASSAMIWTDWHINSGWHSQGFVFCLGMLNAAFAVCAPDITTHMAEEIPKPSRNIPLTILVQYITSFVTGLAYLISLFYATTDLGGIAAEKSAFPLARIYLHATNKSTTVGLLILAIFPTFIGSTGAFGIAARQMCALAKEEDFPFATTFARLSRHDSAPRNAIVFVCSTSALMGLLYIASDTAFNAISGGFVILTSWSYLGALLPHVLSRRKNITPGVFWIPGCFGLIVSALACLYLAAFSVIFCFPASSGISAGNINYTSAIVGGWTIVLILSKILIDHR